MQIPVALPGVCDVGHQGLGLCISTLLIIIVSPEWNPKQELQVCALALFAQSCQSWHLSGIGCLLRCEVGRAVVNFW